MPAVERRAPLLAVATMRAACAAPDPSPSALASMSPSAPGGLTSNLGTVEIVEGLGGPEPTLSAGSTVESLALDGLDR